MVDLKMARAAFERARDTDNDGALHDALDVLGALIEEAEVARSRPQSADEIADMIADWVGRSVTTADRDLALAIIARLNRDADPATPATYRDPTYGWHLDEMA